VQAAFGAAIAWLVGVAALGGLAQDPAVRITGVTIAAAGDIACDPRSSAFRGGLGRRRECRQLATSRLLTGRRYAAILALGDLQYEDGAYSRFLASYHRSWGRLRAKTRPVPGNHEYQSGSADGYFRYFGAAAGDPAKGYYSFELGRWHVVALNSNCSAAGGCEAGSAQESWLRADLAQHASARCTLAYWHHPRFSSGEHGGDATYTAFWRALYEANADVVLAGHDHDYERFAPQTPSGELDRARGIREFVVGTGGKSLRTFPTVRPNSVARDVTSFGVLELTLGNGAYAWRFRPAVGSFTDRGSARCH
jgi:acid phosphatase type 7